MTTDYRWRAHYEPGVVHTVDVPNGTVQQLLADATAAYPDKTAVRMVLRYLPLGLKVQAKLSYRQLDQLSDRFAGAVGPRGQQGAGGAALAFLGASAEDVGRRVAARPELAGMQGPTVAPVLALPTLTPSPTVTATPSSRPGRAPADAPQARRPPPLSPDPGLGNLPTC